MKKLAIAVALLLAVVAVNTQSLPQIPAEIIAEDEVVRSIDDDLDLLNLGMPEFADLDGAMEEAEDSDLDEDEDAGDEVADVDGDDDDEDEEDEDETDVETIKRNQRGKWQRFRANRGERGGRGDRGDRRRHRGRIGRRQNSTESEERPRHRGGRRPWRNQQSVVSEDQESQGPHHHRHRKNDDDSTGRPQRGRHGGRHNGRNRRNRHHRHFRFNMTEARRWESVSWQEKVNHVCSKLTRHKSRIQRAQQGNGGRPGAQDRRERRLEFFGRMEKCCSEEERDSCFYHLRHKVCADRASLQPLRQDLPQPVRTAFTRLRCCRMRGWKRHMCFSTPFSAVHEFLTNQTSASEPISEEVSQEQQPIVSANVKDEPASMDVMMGDMPMVEVGNLDDSVGDDDDLFDMEDLGDLDDDLDDDDDDIIGDDDVSGPRRPHHGRKGRRGRHQGGHKGHRRARMMWRRCCKAGRDEGLGVESEEEASTACAVAADIYLQNVQPRHICKKAYGKCCMRAAMDPL